MMKHKRILVALSSDGRLAAFERALSLAKATGAELYLLHAVPAHQRFSDGGAERLRRSAELRERAGAVGVNTMTVEQQGDPAAIILLHAEARPVDLIVMGTERRTGWARLRERSVAERVLRRTKRPTLVVSDDGSEGPAFEHVLVAVDLSPGSTALIEAALQLSEGKNQRLTVLHAVHGLEAAEAVRHRPGWMVPEYRRHILDGARRQLADLMPNSAGKKVEVQVAPGPAAETIRAYSTGADADLIVVGRSTRFMHAGSTAVRVLRSIDRALLLIPPVSSARSIEGESSAYKRAA